MFEKNTYTFEQGIEKEKIYNKKTTRMSGFYLPRAGLEPALSLTPIGF